MGNKPGPATDPEKANLDVFGIGDILKGLGGFVRLVSDMASNGENRAERKGGFSTRVGDKPLTGAYGFTVHLGVDGNSKGLAQSFPQPASCLDVAAETAPEAVPEAVPEVFVERDHVTVIVDVPGADSVEARITPEGKTVELQARGVGRCYKLNLPIPESADPGNCEAWCRNGIAEVRFHRKATRHTAKKGATP